MKRLISFFLCLLLCFGSALPAQAQDKSYGVFLGMDAEALLKLSDYNLLVCDAQYLSKKQIAQLKAQGNKAIYSYLNIGSLENFRSYYEQFFPYTLGPYENWPEERWMDVSDADWQALLQSIAEELVEKGVDGWFIDNCDVYYFFAREEIYEGLLQILSGLNSFGLPVLINGGSDFVMRAIEEKRFTLFDGINQETVFSSIDFEQKRFGKNKPGDHQYFKDYIEHAAKSGLRVYLLEYTTDPALMEEIAQYCKEKSFDCFISKTLELDKE